MISLLERFLKIEKPKWKIIRIITDSGKCVMDDCSIARPISRVDLAVGEKVLVYQNQILKIHWEDVKNIPIPRFDYILIIVHVGDTTAEYTKK